VATGARNLQRTARTYLAAIDKHNGKIGAILTKLDGSTGRSTSGGRVMAETATGGTGGCLCGAVRYRYEGEPTAVGVCQCDRCQRQSGSAFLIGVVFPREAVSIEGKLASYEATVSGQRLQRHFCPVCGSAMSITLERYPEIRSMMGGTLDDRRKIKPTFSIWCSSGQGWLKLPESIVCYPEYPEGTFGG
jgi:hypothetical protein